VKYFPVIMLCVVVLAFAMLGDAGFAEPLQQDPTVTPQGPQIIVPEQVNVRLGPSIDYELVGVLISGQRATALGRSPGGEWIQIEYPGVPGNIAWVYAPFVTLETSQRLLPIVEPPATPTPRVTATIDPTLAAQFNIGEAEPTRLPTFTPTGPIIYPTFEPAIQTESRGFPPILAILGLMTVGMFGMLISVLRGR
jgi:hypothetical protein